MKQWRLWMEATLKCAREHCGWQAVMEIIITRIILRESKANAVIRWSAFNYFNIFISKWKEKKSKSYFAENKLLPPNNRTLHASLGIAMARVHQRLCNSHKKKPKANSFVTLKKKKHNCS